MLRIIALLTAILFPAYVLANADFPSHVGKSPFSFDKTNIPSNTFVVSDKGQDNDVYLKRDDSKTFDYQFSLKIDRYVGDITKLKENKLISEKFVISMPVFDVDNESALEDCDYDGEPDQLTPEIDEVYFNGEKIGVLSGSNELWVQNRFELDISKLNLPTSQGEVSENVVQIRIDAGNEFVELSSGKVGCQKWAVEIDYVTLEYEVVDPVLLIVGLGGDPTVMTNVKSDYVRLMNNLGLPYQIVSHNSSAQIDSCIAGGTPSIIEHGRNIRNVAVEFSDTLKTNKFNLIAHSKGGLDSRWFINNINAEPLPVSAGLMDNSVVKNTLAVNSLVTHSTPNYGTVVADAIDYNQIFHEFVNIAVKAILTDICDLKTDTATEFSRRHQIPKGIKYLAIGANIDADLDGRVDSVENRHNQIPSTILSTKTFLKIRDVKEYIVEEKYAVLYWPQQNPPLTIPVYIPVANDEPQLNDSLVSLKSATPGGAKKAIITVGNHATVLYPNPYGDIWTGAQEIVKKEALTGMLKWSVGNENH
ncbi:hypothetical protein [Shewanella atlantica]|uniref:Alpha/beta hydrolase n=1 Tax=Shewanella atlantica TaxID=271099 RepID=A0A431WCC7_9GAMM|nr:hypothetical protein [Shewanella atlantica]RTR33166.1 hypothetical protein EKG39_05295 [Shewanella atlantica]